MKTPIIPTQYPFIKMIHQFLPGEKGVNIMFNLTGFFVITSSLKKCYTLITKMNEGRQGARYKKIIGTNSSHIIYFHKKEQ